jgi:flagellar M-ring protein FliF
VRPRRPRHLAGAPPPPAAAATAAFAPVAEPGTEGPSPEESLREREANRQKADMDYAHQTADKDPKLVATLIQHWMNTNE